MEGSFSRVNPDAIGCRWTGEFDLITLRLDGKNLKSGKKKLRIQKYPDTRDENDTEQRTELAE